MDFRKLHRQTRVPLWTLCGVIFISMQVLPTYAFTSSLALQQTDQVVVGNSASFICTASGSAGADPTLVWDIRAVDGTVVETLSGIQDSGVSATDGTISSKVVFTITNSHVGKRLWCGAVESGMSAPSMQIYTSIVEASNVAELGEDCSSGVCSTSFSLCQVLGTVPIQYVCRCASNYYDTNGNSVTGGSCVTKSGLGGSCQTSVTDSCLTQNAECSSTSATCVCQSGFVRSDTICIPDTTAGLGESCVNPQRACTVTSSECIFAGICGCSSGYYQSASNVCSPRGVIGQACISTIASSCSTTSSFCSSTTQTCTCSTGRIYNAGTNSCDLPVLGQTCSVSPGCKATSTGGNTANPECTGSVCTCPNGFYALSTVCYAKIGLGSTCTTTVFDSCSDVNSQCTGSTTSTCQCNFGYVAVNNVCIQDSSTEDCSVATQVSVTTYGITSPYSSTTPDTTVAKTCYTVNLYGTVTLACEDSRGAGAPPLQFGGWVKQPGNVPVIQQTEPPDISHMHSPHGPLSCYDKSMTLHTVGKFSIENHSSPRARLAYTISSRFINGDQAHPSLTISNAQSSDDAYYYCQLCYGTSKTRCTNSVPVLLNVLGTDITSVTASYSPTTVTKGDAVTFTCTTTPANVATSYRWLRNGVLFRSTESFQLDNIQSENAGNYMCEATNYYGSRESTAANVDVLYLPEYSLPGGVDTVNYFGNLDTKPITIQCTMSGNPAVHTFYFSDSTGTVIQSTSNNTYTVYNTMGYGTYKCEADNANGRSTTPQYFDVQLETSTPNTGAATEDTPIATGTIAAIVLGIVFLILLIVIIIVCCCSYGWCRKKEKTQVEPEKPIVQPYIPRSVTSAVSRRDVGVTVNSLPPSEYEEPRYMTPRFYLKPATNGGPIISMYDNDQHQPRPHQLPSLDTSYLYTDDEPKKHHKKHKRRRRHHHDPEPEPEPLPRRSYYDQEPSYDVVAPRDDDLVVIPGRQNYME